MVRGYYLMSSNNILEKCGCRSISLETFQSIELKDIDIFYNINSQIKNIISGYDFVNLFLWSNRHRGKWKYCEGRIYVYYGDEDALFLPVGLTEIEFDKLLRVSDNLIKQGSTGNFIYADYDYVEKHWNKIDRHFEIIMDEDNSDYIYSIDELVELSGKRLKKKRNLIRQFERNNPDYQVKSLKKEYFDKCLELTKLWAKEKQDTIHNSDNYSDDVQPITQAFEYYDELRLEGLCIIVNDKVIAFSVYSKQTEDTIICHIEKFDTDIKGSAQIINKEVAKVLQQKGYKYINREQDLGIPGLKRAKKSYDPLYKKMVCRLIRKK